MEGWKSELSKRHYREQLFKVADIRIERARSQGDQNQDQNQAKDKNEVEHEQPKAPHFWS